MEEPRKDCPFCGCKGEDLEHDEIYINHECCGFVEWNEWNNRPIEDELRARLAASEARVAELEDMVERMLRCGNEGKGVCSECRALGIKALRGEEVKG